VRVTDLFQLTGMQERPVFKRLLLIVTMLISCVGCDQATKSVAKSYLSETEVVSLLGGSVRLQIAKNYGAFLSVGQSMQRTVRTVLLTAGVAAVLVAMFAYGVVTAASSPLMLPALGIIIGGGVSNLLDRLFYGGYVLDFLNVGIGPVRTGIFNVADVFIMAGVLVLVFSNRLAQRPTRNVS
jgi:signal peptidase II